MWIHASCTMLNLQNQSQQLEQSLLCSARNVVLKQNGNGIYNNNNFTCTTFKQLQTCILNLLYAYFHSRCFATSLHLKSQLDCSTFPEAAATPECARSGHKQRCEGQHGLRERARRYWKGLVVGGFNPFKQYLCQIGSFCQVGVKIKKLWTTTIGLVHG